MKSVGIFWKRSLALFLCLIMTFQLMGIALATEMETESEDEYGFAESPGDELSLLEEGSDGEEAPKDIDPGRISGEMEDLREETSKHFRMDDGSFTAIEYNTAVHYQDENGGWVDIDNTLEPVSAFSGGEVYIAANGDALTAFAANLTQGELFSVYSGDYGLEMKLRDSSLPGTLDNSAEASIVEPSLEGSSGDMAEPFNRSAVASVSGGGDSQTYAPSEPSFIPDTLSSTVLYEDVYEGIDLKYELFGYNVKESIIVKTLRDSYSFDFVMDTEGLTPVLEDGALSLFLTKKEISFTKSLHPIW